MIWCLFELLYKVFCWVRSFRTSCWDHRVSAEHNSSAADGSTVCWVGNASSGRDTTRTFGGVHFLLKQRSSILLPPLACLLDLFRVWRNTCSIFLGWKREGEATSWFQRMFSACFFSVSSMLPWVFCWLFVFFYLLASHIYTYTHLLNLCLFSLLPQTAWSTKLFFFIIEEIPTKIMPCFCGMNYSWIKLAQLHSETKSLSSHVLSVKTACPET